MNKISAFIIAFSLMLSCCSCNEKKQDEDIPEETTVTVTEDITDDAENENTPDAGGTVVTGFRELSNDDFQTINVSLTYPDKEAPVTMTKYELPDLDFGERLSPCKSSEKSSKFDPYRSIGSGSSVSNETNYTQMLETPEKGTVEKAFKRGDKIYMFVTYDHFCMFCHEWSVYCYDTVKKTLDEVYNFSDEELFTYPYFNDILESKLIVCSLSIDDSMIATAQGINAVDLETGETEEVYSSSNIAMLASNGTDKLQICITKQTEENSELDILEYDAKTGETKEISKSEVDLAVNSLAASDISAYLRNLTDGCEIVTENYVIGTDIKTFTNAGDCIKMAEIVYASEKKLIIQEYNMSFMTENEEDNPNLKTIVHTYDLEKMEHYITEIDGKICDFASYNGDIVMYEQGTYASYEGDTLVIDHENNSMGTLYYIKPELGLAFKIKDDIILSNMNTYGSSLELNEMEQDTIEVSDENKYDFGKVTALYVLENKEE